LLLRINDGLMAIFFMLVGLEVKRAVVEGELSSLPHAALPVIAALGGMTGQALVYLACNWGDADALRGWAIPTATDIAFALGVLALLGARAPPSLKIFLLALAIIDDLGAITIIAVFYTAELSLIALILAGIGVAALSDLLQPIQLGIGLGLLIGKQLGVLGSIWPANRIGLARLPEGTDWRQMYGVALLTGTGFTMSLFMGTLAFPAQGYHADVRVAVLLGSVTSAICGYVVLRLASARCFA
jgi:Na+/H+ antiporter NhaA